MKKGMLFIDGSNVYYDYRKSANSKLDVEKYISFVKQQYRHIDFVRTYYFTSETETNQGFLQQINQLPYCQVITGHLQKKMVHINETHNLRCCCGEIATGRIVTHVDKGTDVNIAVEMLKHAYLDTYDTAILISRDGDFSGVVRIIKNLGKTVELVLFEDCKNNARDLTDCVDNVTLIYRHDYPKLAIHAGT